MGKNEELKALLEPVIDTLGFELLGCEFYPQRGRSILRIFIDGPNGVNIDDCAKVSRQVGLTLEVENSLQGRYNLEVSSPGVERPLFKIEHYRRFMGHPVRVRLRVPREGGQRHYRGQIEQVEGDQVTLKMGESRLSVSLHEVEKANLDPEV